jgi:effector-binding domain-containing protein
MLMPIGRFSKASRLSVKSLRNYDDSGLLPATYVDPQSGYRYYAVTQLARADAIRSLRMVGMPLAAIAETLDGEAPERSLMSHLESLEQQRDELNRQALELQRRIDLKDYLMNTEVIVKPTPAQTVAFWRTETTYDQIFGHIPEGFGRVMEHLGAENVVPAGIPFTLFHQAPDGDTSGDIAMCVPIGAEITPGPGTGIQTATMGADVVASITHEGSYADMGESYATVVAWITEHGHQITGPAREIYFNSPAEVSEADLRTEILFPIDGEAN